MFLEGLADALSFRPTVPLPRQEAPVKKLGFFLLFIFQLGFFPVNFVIIFGERLSTGNLILYFLTL